MPMGRRNVLTALLPAGAGFVLAPLFGPGFGPAFAQAPARLRIGTLRFGTVAWELDVIRHHALDRAQGIELDIQGFAGNDAADIALMGGAVDVIVEDFLWVARQRAAGAGLTFLPFSSSVGALMASRVSGIRSVSDLVGKRLGVAGGRTDKSWLILQAMARRDGLDLASRAILAYGAPPLLTEKFRSGELDAVLTFWQFAARLEGEGHVRVLGVEDALTALGLSARLPQLGFVVHDRFANANPAALAGLMRASRAAKAILASSDAEWLRLDPLTRAETPAIRSALAERFRAGSIPAWGDAERADAARLYAVLAELGGEALVGPATSLPPGTFWEGVRF